MESSKRINSSRRDRRQADGLWDVKAHGPTLVSRTAERVGPEDLAEFNKQFEASLQ
jgi:hypothetical protein